MSTQGKGTFQITNWDEKSYDEFDGGRKLARAIVTQTYSGESVGEGTTEFLMSYGEDGNASFVGQERVNGRVGERTGSFVLQGSGTFDKGVARYAWQIVPGSGTGDLVGLRGKGSYAAQEGRTVDFTFEYEI